MFNFIMFYGLCFFCDFLFCLVFLLDLISCLELLHSTQELFRSNSLRWLILVSSSTSMQVEIVFSELINYVNFLSFFLLC
jgi:hypothetical protein